MLLSIILSSILVVIVALNCKLTRYYMRWIIIGVATAIMAVFLVPVYLIRPFHPFNMWIGSILVVKTMKYVCRLPIHLHCTENLVKDRTVVTVLNHQSFLDLMVLNALALKYYGHFIIISKKELFYTWPYGLAVWLSGVPRFIDRKNVSRAIDALAGVAKEMDENKSLCVTMFPEGTRNSHPERLLPFKKGPFHLAMQARCPIQPIVIQPYEFLRDDSSFTLDKIDVTILPHIESTDASDVDQLTEKAYNIMQEFILGNKNSDEMN